MSVRAALAEARGKYVAILNDDDVWDREFLSRLVPALEADPRRVLAFCDHHIMDADGRIDEIATERNTERFGRSRLSEVTFADPRRSYAAERRSAGDGALFVRRCFRLSVLCVDVAARTTSGSIADAASAAPLLRPARLTRYRGHPEMETARRDPEKDTVSGGSSPARCWRNSAFADQREYLSRWSQSLAGGRPGLPLFIASPTRAGRFSALS